MALSSACLVHGVVRSGSARWPPRPPGTTPAPITSESAVYEFAQAYANKNERDHRALTDSIGAGRIAAKPGQ